MERPRPTDSIQNYIQTVPYWKRVREILAIGQTINPSHLRVVAVKSAVDALAGGKEEVYGRVREVRGLVEIEGLVVGFKAFSTEEGKEVTILREDPNSESQYNTAWYLHAPCNPFSLEYTNFGTETIPLTIEEQAKVLGFQAETNSHRSAEADYTQAYETFLKRYRTDALLQARYSAAVSIACETQFPQEKRISAAPERRHWLRNLLRRHYTTYANQG